MKQKSLYIRYHVKSTNDRFSSRQFHSCLPVGGGGCLQIPSGSRQRVLADIALQAQHSITAGPGGHLPGLSLSSWAGRTVLTTKGFLLTWETWISLKVFSFYLCSHRQNLHCEVFLLSYVHKGSGRPPECPGLALPWPVNWSEVLQRWETTFHGHWVSVTPAS